MNIAEKIEAYKNENEAIKKRLDELPAIIGQLKREGQVISCKFNANLGAIEALTVLDADYNGNNIMSEILEGGVVENEPDTKE